MVVCKDPARSAEVERKSFEISELSKLRRSNSLTHRAISEGGRRLRRPFGG
jgi:hypothetical protein